MMLKSLSSQMDLVKFGSPFNFLRSSYEVILSLIFNNDICPGFSIGKDLKPGASVIIGVITFSSGVSGSVVRNQ